MPEILRKLVIIISLLTVGVSSRAEAVNCELPTVSGSSEEIYVAACVSSCTDLLRISTSNSTTYFERNCRRHWTNRNTPLTLEQTWDTVVDVLNRSLVKCPVNGAVKMGTETWELAKAMPGLIAGLLGAAWNAVTTKSQSEMEICGQNVDCRRAMARNTVRFQSTNPDGSWKISDAEVDRQIAGVSIGDLHQEALRDRDAVKNVCQDKINEIKSTVRTPGGWGWTYEQRLTVYDRLVTQDPRCPEVLGFERPLPPFNREDCLRTSSHPVVECLVFWEKIEVGNSCMGEDFAKGYEVNGERVKGFNEMVDDFCATAVSAVIPIPGVGPATKVLPGVMSKAGSVVVKSAPELSTSAAVAVNVERNVISAEATAVRGASSELASNAPAAVPTSVALSAKRAGFVTAYREAVYVTEEQNRRFIDLASTAGAVTDPKKTRFFDVENSVMKKLNDVTNDKELVTSLTNFQKQTVLSRVDALKAKYPDLQFEVYSDFKSVKIAVQSGKDIDPALHQKLWTDLDLLYKESNAEFAAKMTEMGIAVPGAGESDQWFKAGFGRSVDEAALAARKARQEIGSPRVIDFTQSEVRTAMSARLHEVEASRQALVQSRNMASLMERSSSGAQVPRQEVFDLVRKNNTPEALASALTARYDRAFSIQEATRLRSYVGSVDEFSPTILVAKRETPSLDAAVGGGATADFLGMGAANLKATAEGIAGQTSLEVALQGARRGEMAVTRTFQQRMEAFKRVVGGTVVCSGDDCVRTATSAISEAEKTRIMTSLARNPDTRSVRMSFIGPGVPQASRMQLASHGESLEKYFRSELEGKVPYTKVRNMTFGFDMQTATINQGTVNLVIGKTRRTRLTRAEQAALQQAFERALQRYNGDVRNYMQGTARTTGFTMTLIPGPGLIGATAQPQDNAD